MSIAKPTDAVPDDANSLMRERSGNASSSSKLVAFLYVLARDHITPGVLEEVMVKQGLEPGSPHYRKLRGDGYDFKFTNGWLAGWASDLAARLATGNET